MTRKSPPTTEADRFAYASSPEAAPEVTEGATICTTPEAIERFRMISLLSGLNLESKGIKVRRGSSCLKIAREQYGIKARRAAAAHQELEAKMIAMGIIEPRTAAKKGA